MKGIRMVVTFNCNIMCTCCRYKCSPGKRGIMSPKDFKDYVEKAYQEGYRDYLMIEGGEPFLYTASLFRYLKKTKSFDMKKYVVTNGFWGDMDPFLDILTDLKGFGLDAVIIEYDYFHSVFIDERKIINAVNKCILCDIKVYIKSFFATSVIEGKEDIWTFEFIKKMREEFSGLGFIFDIIVTHFGQEKNGKRNNKNEVCICYKKGEIDSYI